MFDHLKKLEIEDSTTAKMTLTDIVGHADTGGHPILDVAFAGESNTGYTNAVLRQTSTSPRGRRKRALGVRLKEERQKDRDLYGEHVILGWRGMVDGQGNPIPYSQEAAVAFCQACPSWIFDQIRQFANDPGNYLDDVLDVEGVAGN